MAQLPRKHRRELFRVDQAVICLSVLDVSRPAGLSPAGVGVLRLACRTHLSAPACALGSICFWVLNIDEGGAKFTFYDSLLFIILVIA